MTQALFGRRPEHGAETAALNGFDWGRGSNVVAFRRHTLLPLNVCFYTHQPSIPYLSRSALYRCLQRHEISRLEDVCADQPKRQRFKRSPIGFFHIDIAVQTAEASSISFSQLTEPASSRGYWS